MNDSNFHVPTLALFASVSLCFWASFFAKDAKMLALAVGLQTLIACVIFSFYFGELLLRETDRERHAKEVEEAKSTPKQPTFKEGEFVVVRKVNASSINACVRAVVLDGNSVYIPATNEILTDVKKMWPSKTIDTAEIYFDMNDNGDPLSEEIDEVSRKTKNI